MRWFCRAHILCVWCCAILFVVSYVLFDLLDIDGSNFDHAPGSPAVAEERVASEDADRRVAPGDFPVWLPPRADHSMALPSTPSLTAMVRVPVPRSNQPRAALAPPGLDSSQPASDPARPFAAP